MRIRFLGGDTLEEIGKHYGLTRERVRQLLKRDFGITGKDGGAHARASLNQAARDARRDFRSLRQHGMKWADYVRLLKVKDAHGQSPQQAFRSQRRNAALRGIEWRFTFAEWWSVWQKSGKYPERGRGKGRYVMSRPGDTGPYEMGNVLIVPCENNNREFMNRYWAEISDGSRVLTKTRWHPIYSLDTATAVTLLGNSRTQVNYAHFIAKKFGWKIRTTTAHGCVMVERLPNA